MSQCEPSAVQNMRPDIQGLRTLAVGLVIIYHLYPQKLSGGFVGVDIFLVISGFLIVGSLVRTVSRTGQIHLASFYGRRIRRLLPASTVVLLVVMIATVLVLPQSRWQDVSADVVASAFQVQNWRQAFGASGYESAGSLVSPVQHFWSLAVEEQFYLVIPIMLILAVACGRLLKLHAARACLWFLALVALASFVHSVVFSQQQHDIAYFATTTRMWELAVGGILALVFPYTKLNSVVKFTAGWVGLALVIYSALSFTTIMAFPGYIALVPVMGTVLIIVAGMPERSSSGLAGLSISRYLSLRPVTYLGDISYSLYLWHWPVIVFYVLIRGDAPGIIGGAGVLTLSLALAALSYHQIEQRFRFGKEVLQSGGRRYHPTVRNQPAYILAGTLLVMSCVAAVGPWTVVQIKTLQNFTPESSLDYPGALAFDDQHPARVPVGMPVMPDPAVASKDVPLTTKNGCAAYDPYKVPDSDCFFGDLAGSKTLVLLGDSHAGEFSDPLAAIASKKGWKLRAMVRNGCPFSAAPLSSSTTSYRNCSDQNELSLKKTIAMAPKRVVIVGMTPYGYKNALNWHWATPESSVDGYVKMLRALDAAGIKVSVIADTPYPQISVPDCVEKNGPTSEKCQTVKKHVPDPLVMAADEVGTIQVIDINTYLCKKDLCPPLIGNVLVYRDNHLTATFAKTLAMPLEEVLALD